MTAAETPLPSGSKRTAPPEIKKLNNAAGLGGGTVIDGVYKIKRPSTYSNHIERTWVKQHKFLTYGYSPFYKNNWNSSAKEIQHSLTTSLCQVPVHDLALYMDYSEIGQLKPGEYAKRCQVTVIQRNVRVAFETNSTTSALATLNQNKNGVFAIGLLNQPWGCNVQYTSSATKPMEPTAIKRPIKHNDWMKLFYGHNDWKTISPSMYYPPHHIGIPVQPPNYYCMCMTDVISAAISATPCKPRVGWPQLTSFLNQFEASDAVGLPICNYSYEFDKAPLQSSNAYIETTRFVGTGPSITDGPHMYIGNNSCDTVKLEVNQNTSDWKYGKVTLKKTAHYNKTPFTSSSKTNIEDMPIEKSQFVTKGLTGTVGCRVQPSLHIGVMPVPSLTTNIAANVTKWTDVQSYFDLECVLITGYDERVEYNTQSTCSEKLHDVWYMPDVSNTDEENLWPAYNSGCIGGIHPYMYTSAPYSASVSEIMQESDDEDEDQEMFIHVATQALQTL
ncbi:unnamed protein product [Orchesella dallaii]|uniref:Capsid protein n=1 Tax=Orchesella dallaii TaxID=48710 RepID=A0ABP1RMR9_9HEXA